MRFALAAAIAIASSAHAEPSVVAQVRSPKNGLTWSVAMRFERHPPKGVSAMSLEVTRGGNTHRYQLKHGDLYPSQSYAKPLLAVVRLPGVDEPIL